MALQESASVSTCVCVGGSRILFHIGFLKFFLCENSPSGSRPLSALIASCSASDGAPAAAAGLAVVRFLTDFITVFFGADPVCQKLILCHWLEGGGADILRPH